MLLPYSVDVPFDRKPFVNWLLVASVIFTFALSIAVVAAKDSFEPIERFVLKGWSLSGIFGHLWIHGGILHLIGNMIFLWIFGNAICAKIENLHYIFLYLFLGLVSSVFSLLFNQVPAVGASGAINGLVGMYLIMYPVNDISCFYWYFFTFGTFTISSYWMICMWFIFDIIGLVSGNEGVGYIAHISGFLTGALIALALLYFKIVKMNPRYETSLFDVFKKEPEYQSSLDKQSSLYFRNYDTLHDKEHAQPEPTVQPKPQPQVQLTDEDFLKQDPLIRFHCHCGQRIKVKSKHAGKKGRCPKCKEPVKIPLV